MQDIIAPRCQLATNRLTRKFFAKTFAIKITASLLKRNNTSVMKNEGATKSLQ
jgi:hypothetical protein